MNTRQIAHPAPHTGAAGTAVDGRAYRDLTPRMVTPASACVATIEPEYRRCEITPEKTVMPIRHHRSARASAVTGVRTVVPIRNHRHTPSRGPVRQSVFGGEHGAAETAAPSLVRHCLIGDYQASSAEWTVVPIRDHHWPYTGYWPRGHSLVGTVAADEQNRAPVSACVQVARHHSCSWSSPSAGARRSAGSGVCGGDGCRAGRGV
jgi:hypothetical protein